MENTYKDYRPEVKSLLSRLLAAGFTILKAWHEHSFAYTGDLEKFVEECCACDDVNVKVECNKCTCTLWLVLGNEPGVVCADYSVPKEWDVDALEDITDAHYKEWQNKAQPMRTYDELALKVRTQ